MTANDLRRIELEIEYEIVVPPADKIPNDKSPELNEEEEEEEINVTICHDQVSML
jgi:hypothetical protein